MIRKPTPYEVSDKLAQLVKRFSVFNVSGGAKPYSYTITFEVATPPINPIKGQTAENGWIVEPLDPKVTSGKIVVTDGKKDEVTREFKVRTENPAAGNNSAGTPPGGAANQGGSPGAPKSPKPSPTP